MPASAPVLVVDDNEDLRDLLCEFLFMLGHQPMAARDGLEALQMLADGRRPLLVLLDRHIPRMDGLAFLEEAAQSLRGVPVIWMTGAADDVQHPLVRATLRKPFDLEALERAVSSYLSP